MTIFTGVITTRVDSSAQYALGTIYEHFNGKKFKYVNLNNTSATVAGAAGDIAAYGLSGVNDNLVVLDNNDAATKPIGAGVVMATITGTQTTSYYVWLQVTGAFTANNNLLGSPSDGDALYLSTTDKVLTLATAADDPVCAYADDDSADECIAAFAY